MLKNIKIYKDIADIYLFDSKGYEKSMSFDHSLIENIKFNKEVMLQEIFKLMMILKNIKK